MSLLLWKFLRNQSPGYFWTMVQQRHHKLLEKHMIWTWRGKENQRRPFNRVRKFPGVSSVWLNHEGPSLKCSKSDIRSSVLLHGKHTHTHTDYVIDTDCSPLYCCSIKLFHHAWLSLIAFCIYKGLSVSSRTCSESLLCVITDLLFLKCILAGTVADPCHGVRISVSLLFGLDLG